MNIRQHLILITTIGVASCVTQQKVSDLSQEQQSSYQRIVASNIDGRTIEIIAPVEGYFCFRDSTKVTKNNKPEIRQLILKTAQDDLRINAAKLNADAISEESCKSKGVDWAKNCWASVTCIGNAVKFK